MDDCGNTKNVQMAQNYVFAHENRILIQGP